MKEIMFHIMVPVYKVEPYLDECVQSVLDQTYRNFRLYLVDDGSPDNCPALCDAAAQRDPRVRVWHNSNHGALYSRVFAIARACETGVTERDFAVFLDSDDTLRPYALETMVSAIEAYACDCVIFGMERVLNGRTLSRLSVPSEEPLLITDKAALCHIVMMNGDAAYYSMCRKAVRMDMLSPDMDRYALCYGISIGEDALQSLEVYQNAESVCFLPETLYDYRLNPDSMTQTVRYENYRVDYTVWEKELRLLEEEAVYSDAELAAYRSFRIHALTGELVRIAALDAPRSSRVELYRQIKQTAYWREFLDGGHYNTQELGKMAVVYEAFRKGHYGLIFLLERGYSLLRKLRGQ